MVAAWHGHHDVLLSFLGSIEERIGEIKRRKPSGEQPLRLALIKEVEGQLPPQVMVAGKAYDKATEAYDKATEAYDKAWKAYDKAWEAYYKALDEHKGEIEALHREECPNCPWDGKTIFPPLNALLEGVP